MDADNTVRLGPLALAVSLRPYEPRDEDATATLWLRAWQAAYPQIDFAERLAWWRERWRNELTQSADIVIAETQSAVIGFVTVDPLTSYLDQVVVAPEHWDCGVGTALIAVAKQLSPAELKLDVNTDNARAIRFYDRQGFAVSGDGVNPMSGRPVHHMRWAPRDAAGPNQLP